jgi:broad specificity phosphatase PhoE
MFQMMEKLRDNPLIGIQEDSRLVELQFGNFQDERMSDYKAEKYRYGYFFYRFPNGESGLDVYNRVTSFIGSLFREWQNIEQVSSEHKQMESLREVMQSESEVVQDNRCCKDNESVAPKNSSEDAEEPCVMEDLTVVLVTHGLALRLFLMRWFHFTVHQFEESANPANCAVIVMERKSSADLYLQQHSADLTSHYLHQHHHHKSASSYYFELTEESKKKLKFYRPCELAANSVASAGTEARAPGVAKTESLEEEVISPLSPRSSNSDKRLAALHPGNRVNNYLLRTTAVTHTTTSNTLSSQTLDSEGELDAPPLRWAEDHLRADLAAEIVYDRKIIA